jgi:phage terminase small subunit
MAGVKGKSGGARPNSGGKREGAGRKRVAAVPIAPEVAKAKPGEPLDPRPTLELVALGHMEVSPSQMKALLALLPYVHVKRGEGGKKDAAVDRAKKAATGRFAPKAPPRLVVDNR